MGSIYEFRVKVRAPDEIEDYGSFKDAADLFVQYGCEHQDWSIEVIGLVEAEPIECVHSDDGKHTTFEDEEGEEPYWSEGLDWDGNFVREQDCFNCGQTVTEMRTDES